MGRFGRRPGSAGLHLRAYGAWLAAIAMGLLVGAALSSWSRDPYGLLAFVVAIATGVLVLVVLTLALGIGGRILLVECALAAAAACLSVRLSNGALLIYAAVASIPALAVLVGRPRSRTV